MQADLALSKLLAVIVVAATAPTSRAASMDLHDCRLRLDVTKGRFVARCDVATTPDVADSLAAGLTVIVGDGDTVDCFTERVSLTRAGRCWTYRGDATSSVRRVKLCDDRRQSGHYRLRLTALDPDRLACIDRPDVSFAVAVADAEGRVACEHDGQTCLVRTVTNAECRNASPFRDCSRPASVDCRPAPFNCEQATKLCDPRPRTARRDDPDSTCFAASIGTPVTDSLGNELGRLNEGRLRLNFGIHRVIGGDTKVMAFSVSTNTGTRTGWVSRAAVTGVPSDFMATSPLPAATGATGIRMIVPDGWTQPMRDLKTDLAYCGTGTGSAWHYLGRAEGTVNMVWSTPGLGSPTVEVYPNRQKLDFHLSGVPAVEVPLYDCATRTSPRRLRFVYGYVEPGRWGWIAEPNLSLPCRNDRLDPGEECDDGNDADGDGCENTCYFTRRPCDVQCCDGSWQHLLARDAQECSSFGAGGLCNRNGNWTLLVFGGASVAAAPCSDQCGIECCKYAATQAVGGVLDMRGPAILCANFAHERCASAGSGVRNVLFYPGGAGNCDWCSINPNLCNPATPDCSWIIKDACPVS